MIDLETLQSTLLTIATLSMGFYFGSQYTGRKAQPTYMGEMPSWLATVKTVNAIMLIVFTICILGAVVIHERAE